MNAQAEDEGPLVSCPEEESCDAESSDGGSADEDDEILVS